MSKRRKRPLPAKDNLIGDLDIVLDLPISHYKGIGRIVYANAVLEFVVSQLVHALLRLSPPEGRVSFEYRGASTMFHMARSLFDVHGIVPKADLADLEDKISKLCTARDQLAHNLWVNKEGEIVLRLTQGNYESAEGKRSRAIHPQTNRLAAGYFEDTRAAIMATAEEIAILRDEVRASLATSLEKSE